MAVINLSNFTFTAEQIRNINELVYEGIAKLPELSAIHTMFDGIVYDKEIGFITGGGLVGKKGQGCDPEVQDFSVATRKVTWTPKEWEVYIDECAEALKNTMVVYSMNKGTRVDDLTDTDYMAIVVEVLIDAVKQFLYRIIWFGDTDATNVSGDNGGLITAGVDTGYFDIIDGLFKQLETMVANTPAIGVTISANNQASKALQMSSLTPDLAYALLSDMYYQSNPKMRERKGELRFLVTQSVADKYEQYLTGKGISETYKNLVDGIQALSFNGIPVIPMPVWDGMIQSYQDLGATYNKPHRALLCTKAVIAVGTPSTEAFGEVDLWYDKTSRKNYVLIKDKIDAKILSDKMVVYAE